MSNLALISLVHYLSPNNTNGRHNVASSVVYHITQDNYNFHFPFQNKLVNNATLSKLYLWSPGTNTRPTYSKLRSVGGRNLFSIDTYTEHHFTLDGHKRNRLLLLVYRLRNKILSECQQKKMAWCKDVSKSINMSKIQCLHPLFAALNHVCCPWQC